MTMSRLKKSRMSKLAHTLRKNKGKNSNAVITEYIPPPPQNIPPPAKYKLWLCIFVTATVMVIVASKAGFPIILGTDGFLSPTDQLFTFLLITIFALAFAFLEAFIETLTFEVKGKVYGIGWWFAQPRATWMKKYDNPVVDFIGVLIKILEDGFAIFDATDNLKESQIEADMENAIGTSVKI